MRDGSRKDVLIRTNMIQELFTEATHRKGGILCLEKCYCLQESFWSLLVLSFCTGHFILRVRFFDGLEMHVLTFKCSFSMFITECCGEAEVRNQPTDGDTWFIHYHFTRQVLRLIFDSQKLYKYFDQYETPCNSMVS